MPKHCVVLISCGSFNPPTYMHCRMFEVAKNYFEKTRNYDVVLGLLSPVHSGYAKKDLCSFNDRSNMVSLLLSDSDWLFLSSWEGRQLKWTNTLTVLRHLKSSLMDFFASSSDFHCPSSLRLRLMDYDQVHVKFLCGSDLVESFCDPSVWPAADVQCILSQFGVVTVERSGCSDVMSAIKKYALLSNNLDKIDIVSDFVHCDLSSSAVRVALSRGESVKYLLPDSVLKYIAQNSLYGHK